MGTQVIYSLPLQGLTSNCNGVSVSACVREPIPPQLDLGRKENNKRHTTSNVELLSRVVARGVVSRLALNIQGSNGLRRSRCCRISTMRSLK